MDYQTDENGDKFFIDSLGRKVYQKNLAHPEIKPRVFQALINLGKAGKLGPKYHEAFKVLEFTATKDLKGSTITEKANELAKLTF